LAAPNLPGGWVVGGASGLRLLTLGNPGTGLFDSPGPWTDIGARRGPGDSPTVEFGKDLGVAIGSFIGARVRL